MNKFIHFFLELFVITAALVFGFVPVKYLPIRVDPDSIHAVDVPGAQAVEYYDVFGRNTIDLWREMQTKGVDEIGGLAITSYSIGYKFYKVNPDTPECRIRDVEVSYAVKVVLPHWSNLQNASLADVWLWELILKWFASHEGEHVRILLDNVGSVKEAIEAGTCETAAAEGEKAIQSILQLERDYDLEGK